MPARDGTGPTGQGARTGRGMGDCASGEQRSSSFEERSSWNPLRWFGGRFGGGMGRGRHRGAGRGGHFNAGRQGRG
ncbi:MAG: DUF5320 domain-containing protein [Chloroflexi bacterium]|nr:DUF5320 domain-containing protein [Chloroflexota bacterium]